MQLTKLQIDIIEHRLGQVDAIHEVANETDGAPSMTLVEVMDLCDTISRWVRLDETLEEIITRAEARRGALWILVECLEGSTYLAAASSAADAGDISRQKYQGIKQSFEALHEAVGADFFPG